MAIVTDYKIGVKREVVNALKPVFGPSYPDSNLAGKVYVGLEYPLEQINYPAIFVTFTEGPIQSVGVGHYELDEEKRIFSHFKFKGTLNFNVIALNPVDRDMLSAGLVQMLTIGRHYPHFKDFFNQIMDADWVALQPLTDEITPNGENIAPVPWGNDEQQAYINSYSIQVFGEFVGDAEDGGLIQISQVNVYPYRPDSPLPQGTPDPAPWE